MENLNLRDASECDAPIIADLIYDTEDSPEHIWGQGSKGEILTTINYLIKLKNSRYYYKNIKIAELNGKTCGAIILLKSEDISKLDFKTSLYTFFYIKGFKRKFNYLLDYLKGFNLTEGGNNELYIANLATNKNLRGKGIGRALLNLADKTAKEAGYNRCSLLAKDKNLISFYSKCNYKFEKKEKYFSHYLYRMVKTI